MLEDVRPDMTIGRLLRHIRDWMWSAKPGLAFGVAHDQVRIAIVPADDDTDAACAAPLATHPDVDMDAAPTAMPATHAHGDGNAARAPAPATQPAPADAAQITRAPQVLEEDWKQRTCTTSRRASSSSPQTWTTTGTVDDSWTTRRTTQMRAASSEKLSAPHFVGSHF